MKTIIGLLLIVQCFTACSTYKDISKGNELNETIIKSKLEPGRKYEINLRTGLVLRVRLTEIDSLNIYGYQQDITGKLSNQSPFSDSYKNLYKNANRISMKKFNPTLTAAVPLSIWPGI